MGTEFWEQVLTVVVSAGVGSGFFWVLLQKGVEQKLAVILEKQKAEFLAQIHAQNTVFSRVDKQRADAVQIIDTELKAYNWEFIDFKPRSALNHLNDHSEASEQAYVWCLTMQAQAKKALVSYLNSSLLLPDELGLKIGAGWYQLASWFPVELIRVFGNVVETDEYKLADDNKKRELLFNAKNKFAPELQEKFSEINQDITKDLRQILTRIEKTS